MDQTIEETINKDTDTARGTKGFRLNARAVAKSYITSEYRSPCITMMRQMAEIQHEGLNHPDLRPSRTKREEGDVKSLTEMFKNVWQKTFSLQPQEQSSISTGASPCEEAKSDLCNAKKIGKEAYDEFVRRRLLEDRDTY